MNKTTKNQSNPFQSLGHLCKAIKDFKTSPANPDPAKMMAAGPTTTGRSDIGQDGGYACPVEFQTEILDLVKVGSLLGLTDSRTTQSIRTVTPVDEVAPWDLTAGVQANWLGEGDEIPASKPEMEFRAGKLNKLTAMIPATAELMDDTSAFDAYLRRKTVSKFTAAVNSAIVAGDGVGKLLGILNSPCLLVVDKETDQTASTITGTNLLKMHGRWFSESRDGAWLYNKNAEAQLLAAAATAGILEPGCKILGLPLIPTQPCKTLGNMGDVILADMAAYQTVVRAGGMTVDVSIHKWFDTGTLAFRFTLRIDGQPWWSSPVDPENGNDTLSPFVALQERA